MEFLENWNLECDDYGYSGEQKCTRLHFIAEKPFARLLRISLVIPLITGLLFRWNLTALYQIVLDTQAGMIDLNVYVLRYSSISEALVQQDALSTLDRVNRLLSGLSDEHRRKVLNFCVKKKWRLSAQNIDKAEHNYRELKAFILTEGETTQMLSAYDKEKTT